VPVFWRTYKVGNKERENRTIKADALLTPQASAADEKKVGFFFATVGD
jgi:hypothetical protein